MSIFKFPLKFNGIIAHNVPYHTLDNLWVLTEYNMRICGYILFSERLIDVKNTEKDLGILHN